MRPAAADRIGSGFSLSDNLSWPESKADRRGRQIRCPIDPTIDQHMLCASRWGKKLFYLLPFPLALETDSLFAWLISHQPAVLFSQNKPATSNQPAVLFSQNKSAPAINHQPNEPAERGFGLRSVDAIAAFFHRLHQSTSCTC
jgi:hypothetical protein